jgi:glucose-6-phosphate isomerase
MQWTKEQLWERFKRFYFHFHDIDLSLDLSRLEIEDSHLAALAAKMDPVFRFMSDLEGGAIANPDEKRMVGHYWLRNPALAPTPEIRKAIEETVAAIRAFADDVHQARIKGANGPFINLILIGIGGSALGPQFVSHALSDPAKDRMTLYSFDNTDPDGMDKVLVEIGGELGRTLCLVVSKSGATKETRNGMLEVDAAYKRAGLEFSKHAVAITEAGSHLDKHATAQAWIRRFPMWDWVGGRTSETSAVGLLPAALQGFDIARLLEGAGKSDEITRRPDLRTNPAALLAAAWFIAGEGVGSKAMVILPYKDRLELFSRYLQQLIMESLGKEQDLDGRVVHQGFTAYGNKGSTDQHAYIQQLRDGPNNFFVTFIEVLQHRSSSDRNALCVEPDVTTGDFLNGFLLGTRDALFEKGRQSITVTIGEVSPFSVGVLIALYERAVGLYARLININAYHQPGVEAGKKAAGAVIDLERRVIAYLREKQGHRLTSDQIASGIGAHGEFETVFKICQHLAANARVSAQAAPDPFAATYEIK